MGVEGLWKLLAPCGHRVSIETLTGTRVAVDVSIWLVQFLKAMRDPATGVLSPNAHLLGLLRRVLRLLFHGIQPIFVFDGPAPALKRTTLAARKRIRDQFGDSMKRQAEKILLGQLKMRSIQQLRKKLAERAAGTRGEGAAEAAAAKPKRQRKQHGTAGSPDGSSAGAAAETHAAAASSAGATADSAIDIDAEEHDDGDEKETDGPAVGSPPRRTGSGARISAHPEPAAGAMDDDEPLPMLPEGSTSDEAESGDEARAGGGARRPRRPRLDEAFVLPADGQVDPVVLAKLPISLQYEVMQQQREHTRFHNMHRFTAVEHNPSAFSDLQLEGFLKSVRFSQSIDQLREEMNLSVQPGAALRSSSSVAGAVNGGSLKPGEKPQDGSQVVVEGSAHLPSAPSSGFIYYKSTAPTAPFAWKEAVKESRAREARRQRDGGGAGGAGDSAPNHAADAYGNRIGGGGSKARRQKDRDGMESVEEERKRLFEVDQRALREIAAAEAAARLDQDWLCEHCAAVNTNLRRLNNDAAKLKCQTCGAKREDLSSASSLPAAPAAVKQERIPSLSQQLSRTAAAVKEPSPTASSSTWVSPAERYLQHKQPNATGKPMMSAAAVPSLVASSALPPARTNSVSKPTTAGPKRQQSIPLEGRKADASSATVVVMVDDAETMPALEAAAERAHRPSPPQLAASVHAALDDRDAVTACARCTFINPLGARVCGMCESNLTQQNVALLSGPGSLTASFQAKAARRVAHIAEQQAIEASVRAVKDNTRITSSGGSGTPPRPATATPPTPVRPISAGQTASSTAPASAAPAMTTEEEGDALEITFNADDAAAPTAEPDVVDELFTSVLTAKATAVSPLQPTVQRVQPAQAEAAGSQRASVHSVGPLVAAPSKPLSANFLELSEGDDDEEKGEAAAPQHNAPDAVSETDAERRVRERRTLERREEAQIRRATRALLKDVRAREAIKNRAGGSGLVLATGRAASTAPAAVVDLSEASIVGNSFETAEVVDEDIQWEEDDDATGSSAVAPPPPPVQTVSAQPMARTSSAAQESEQGAAPMDMDESDDDGEKAVAAVHRGSMLKQTIAVKEEAELQPATAAAVAPVTTSSAPSPKLSGRMQDDNLNVSPVVDAGAPFSSQADVEDDSPSASAAAANAASAEPEAMTEPESAAAAAAVASAPVSLARLSLAESDPLVLDLPSDDEETARDRATLQQLLGELDDLQDSLKAAAQMEGQPGAEPIVDVTAAAKAAAVREAVTVEGEGEEEHNEEEKEQGQIITRRERTPDAPAVTPASPPAAASFSVDSHESPAVVSAARESTGKAFAAQRALRAVEAVAERERRATLDARDAAMLGQPMEAVPPVGAASAVQEQEVGWQAFPQHLSTEEAVGLSTSFDSSYLETNAAAKAANEARRGMEHVTEAMIAESKELLQMCGIPYIEAPGEAEAQCAALEQVGLVKGVVTDDSDVFLFGAQQVYRHLFESKMYCESYRMKEIEAKLGMDRQKLIHFALLLGSDYTEGVKGVGIVNATEILNAFPGERGLEQLRQWVYSDEADEPPVLPQFDEETTSDAERARLAQAYRIAHFKHAHRRVKRNWGLSASFPNRAVIDAYWNPNVDRSGAEFSWQAPDWEAIAGLCGNKLGWSAEQITQNLSPVIKSMESSHGRQGALDRFFHPDDQFAAIGSSRLNLAVRGLVNKQTPSLTPEELAHQAHTQARKDAQAEKRRQKAREKAAQKRAEKTAAARAADGEGADEEDADGVVASAAAGPAGTSVMAQRSSSLLDDHFDLTAEEEAKLAALETAASPSKPAATAAAAHAAPTERAGASKPRRPRKRKEV